MIAGGFGQELRRRREAAGLSLSGLAGLVHYSTGYLSKIENDRKLPTADLARLCDAVLGAGGQLAALVPEPLQAVEVAAPIRVDAARPEQQVALSGVPTRVLRASAPSAADGFEVLLADLRDLGRRVTPSILLDTLGRHTEAMRALGGAAGDRALSARLFRLAALSAEYTGWMAQESGDEPSALYWMDHAGQLASAAGDHDLMRYTLLRRADLALDRYDAAAAVAFARQVHDDRLVSPAVRGPAFLREAQGHSLFGDFDSCLASLDHARALLDEVGPGGHVRFGSTGLADPVAMITGWALSELGRPADAAEILAKEVPRVATGSLRTRTRFAARLTVAYASSGELDAACGLATDLLPDAQQIDSASVRTELRTLLRILSRWNTHPPVRTLRPLLLELLATSQHADTETAG